MDELAHFVDASGFVPDPSCWAGRLYMTPAKEIAQSLCALVLSGSNKERAKAEHHQCDITLTGDEITHVCRQSGNEKLEKIPMPKWFGRIKKRDFNYFIVSHEAIVGGSAGEGGWDREGKRTAVQHHKPAPFVAMKYTIWNTEQLPGVLFTCWAII
jgi:hypothetical protein